MQYWPSLKGPLSEQDDDMSSTRDIETQYCAHSYHPLAVVLTRGEGVFVWNEVGAAVALIDRAVARIQQLLGEMQPRRLAP